MHCISITRSSEDPSQMSDMRIKKKKVFLYFVTISAASLLLQQSTYWSWTKEPVSDNCLAREFDTRFLTKHTNVVFLKTHKTASSTMQNIFYRFAERHNLTVALPKQACGGQQFCFPASFTTGLVNPFTLPANIVTNHMRFNKAELGKFMPPDTVYITIMREPSAMFESLFVYCYVSSQSIRRVPNGSLQTFLDNPFKYYRPNEGDSMYARNCLTFDLGGDKDNTDVAYAESLAAQVEKQFNLVMISEYFDESLILLRHLLNWDLEDLIYFKSNMRSEKSKLRLTPSLSAKIRAWNSVDAHLYDHFNASLWRQLSALGLDCVAREVQLLRQAQEQLMKTCFGGQTPLLRSASQIKNKELKPWQPGGKVDVLGYELSPDLSAEAQAVCTKLTMPELQYTAALLQSQTLRYKQLHPNTA